MKTTRTILLLMGCTLAAVMFGATSDDAFARLSPELTQRIKDKRKIYSDTAKLEAWIAAVPAEIQADANVRYSTPEGSDPRLTSIDVFHSKRNAKPQPIVIFVHGGGFSAGDKSHAALVRNKALFFPRHGLVFISANYRLAPEVGHPTQTEDIADAVAFVRKHAADWGGDPDAIFLVGHSAGAQIVVQLVSDGSFLARRHVPIASIRGVISADTQMLDLPAALENAREEAPLREIVEMVYGKTRDRWLAASPIAHLSKGGHWPPLLLFHSGSEQSPSATAARKFADAWRAAGGQAEVQSSREKDHPSLGRDIGKPGDWITETVMQFFTRNAAPSPAS